MKGTYGTKRRTSRVKALRDTMNAQLDTLYYQLRQEDDPVNLDGLERQFSAVQTFATALSQRADNIRVQLARDWNRNLPVHRLPNELLTHILMQTRETSKDLDTRSVIRWTTVCSIWRHGIIGTPSMWRRIDLRDGYLSFLALRRNKSAPLEIHWRDPELSTDGDSSPGIALPHALYRSLAPRCCDIHMDVVAESAVSRELLELYGQYATKIDIYGRDRNGLHVTLPIGPIVHSMALMWVETALETWSSPRLVGLKFLLLQGLQPIPNDDQFYRMLASAPCLSTIMLEILFDDSSAHHENLASTTPILFLPNMKRLYVAFVPARLIRLLTRKVQLPNCEHFYFMESLSSRDVATPSPLLQSLPLSSWTSCNLTAALSGRSIFIYNEDRNVLPWLQDYILEFGSPSNLYVGITVEDGDPWENTVSALSHLFPAVHRLTVKHEQNFHGLLRCRSVWQRVHFMKLEGPASFLTQTIHLLGQQRSRTISDNPLEAVFLAPQLSSLSIRSDEMNEGLEDIVEEIIGLVRAQYSFPGAVDAASIPRLQIAGPEELIGALGAKGLPPNIVLLEN